jgi:ATP-dependent DNA helicase RecQ
MKKLPASLLSPKSTNWANIDTEANQKTLLEALRFKYIYIDLEIGTDKSIYRLGVESLDLTFDLHSENLEQLERQLNYWKKQHFSIAGHNFRRFDAHFFFKQYPDIAPWQLIDTLELSVIIKPLQLSHKLHKDYKLSEYAGNNPLEDARATKLL